MDPRIAILILLALAKATPDRYYEEKSAYNIKSSGESENDDRDINCSLWRTQSLAVKKKKKNMYLLVCSVMKLNRPMIELQTAQKS